LITLPIISELSNSTINEDLIVELVESTPKKGRTQITQIVANKEKMNFYISAI
jgi:hypothetical protein